MDYILLFHMLINYKVLWFYACDFTQRQGKFHRFQSNLDE